MEVIRGLSLTHLLIHFTPTHTPLSSTWVHLIYPPRPPTHPPTLPLHIIFTHLVHPLIHPLNSTWAFNRSLPPTSKHLSTWLHPHTPPIVSLPHPPPIHASPTHPSTFIREKWMKKGKKVFAASPPSPPPSPPLLPFLLFLHLHLLFHDLGFPSTSSFPPFFTFFHLLFRLFSHFPHDFPQVQRLN